MSAPTSDDLRRLIKLLRMTTSSVDSEALTAMRMANKELARFGGDWERLLSGKITIVADPFPSMPEPPRPSTNFAPPTPPARPQPPAPHAPRASRTPPPPHRKSTRHNAYLNYCWTCGCAVPPQFGFLIRPADHVLGATKKWEVLCTSCNSDPSVTITATRAKKQIMNLEDLI